MSTRALRTAATGMYAQQLNIQVISNNIANMNTTSFKKSRAEFKDLITKEKLIQIADKGLYHAKEHGRNQIIINES